MSGIAHIAFIGNSLPRRCGIATFTTDLQQAVAATGSSLKTCVVAMTDHGYDYKYPNTVSAQIADDDIFDYIRAAGKLNASGCDIVSLQHEYGIFGGPAGGHILALVSRLNMPVVTTLHTVLAEPSADQRRVTEAICGLSARLVVMARKGRELLRDVYQVPVEKIDIIPHGIPDVAFSEPDKAKASLGFGGRTVILTFGLLSPSKGIEVMIDAMPEILRSRPDAVYVVLGATHPNLVRQDGEAYRASLLTRAQELGIAESVVFLNRFVERDTLLDYISMCDVYVTPYLNEAQMTSGTLAYSFGLGRAVVSTPYWHARELLTDGCGVLVPFNDAQATGQAIAELLADEGRLQAIRHQAYAQSRCMTWARTAARYLETFSDACKARATKVVSLPTRSPIPVPGSSKLLPDMNFTHFLNMCDDTGFLQHAVLAVPDRSHGYCIDDNARALLLACTADSRSGPLIPEVMTSRFAAFIGHAWNPDKDRFRNFMGFDRRWLEDVGSEDSHGRTLWALGQCAESDPNHLRRDWAKNLFHKASAPVDGFRSPRAWAFALLGLDPYCRTAPEDDDAQHMRSALADRLLEMLRLVETPDWTWFEGGLAYDNARLSQALIETGVAGGIPEYTDAGLRTLQWLMARQTSPEGLFRPVGTHGFGEQRQPPRPFDQQPLEAAATIAACLAAGRANGDVAWQAEAMRAFSWFHGKNDLGLDLIDAGTGSCRDGLHPDRANENRGGESVVSYLLALSDIRQAFRSDRDGVAIARWLA